MTLRLSSTSTTSAPSTSHTGHPLIDRLLQDASLSVAQKQECLNTLKVILKNLMDPTKHADMKYRTLKLDNAKLQTKLFGVVDWMLSEFFVGTLGFSKDDDRLVISLANPPSSFTIQSIYTPLQASILAALTSLQQQPLPPPPPAANNHKKAKMEHPLDKLSEKQKARKLLEEKEALARQQAKEDRKRQLALLQEDKTTRLTDPNWKPGLSAACAKSGTSISTFRDKYGEN